MIKYSLTLKDGSTNRLFGELQTTHAGGDLRLAIAAWISGSYLLRDFIRYFSELEATIDGEPVELERLPEANFIAKDAPAGELKVRWSIYGHELTVRTPHIDNTHAFFNGVNAVPYFPDRRDEPLHVTINAPEGWEVYCPLPADAKGFIARDWDTLADTPFELGPDHLVMEFDCAGVPHRAIIWGHEQVTFDWTKLTAETKRIVELHADKYGGLPYDNYDFIIHVTQSARGGLEHSNSTTLVVSWAAFKQPTAWADFLSLIAHEHLHVWNAKRVRPAGLWPMDYQRQMDTRDLWWVEGATSYMDTRAVLEAKLITADFYLAELQTELNRFDQLPGRDAQCILDAARDAWFRLYKPDADSPNRTVSYYLHGSLICMALDIQLRVNGTPQASIDKLMQLLIDDYNANGEPWTWEDMFAHVKTLGGDNAAQKLDAWLRQLGKTQTFEDALAMVGVSTERYTNTESYSGLRLHRDTVRHLLNDGPAANSGLCPGDKLLTVNGAPFDPESPTSVDAFPAGTLVTVEAQRRGVKVTASWQTAEPKPRLLLAWSADADEQTIQARADWLYLSKEEAKALG